jgi:hypothetical protein
MHNSATPYRVLDPKLTLTGASGDSLQNTIVDPLPNGSVAWVIAENGFWYLAKYSTEAVGADVIATIRGSGSPGRWKRVGGSTSFTPAYSEVFMSGSVIVPAGANWQILPESTFTTMENQNIDDSGDVFTIPADQPSGLFLVRAIASYLGEDTEQNDTLSVGLAISRNAEIIGTAVDGQAQGSQRNEVVYASADGLPTLTIVAERLMLLDPTDTVRGAFQIVQGVGDADGINLQNYTFSILRLNNAT